VGGVGFNGGESSRRQVGDSRRGGGGPWPEESGNRRVEYVGPFPSVKRIRPVMAVLEKQVLSGGDLAEIKKR
jgi:hypothetical protein